MLLGIKFSTAKVAECAKSLDTLEHAKMVQHMLPFVMGSSHHLGPDTNFTATIPEVQCKMSHVILMPNHPAFVEAVEG